MAKELTERRGSADLVMLRVPVALSYSREEGLCREVSCCACKSVRFADETIGSPRFVVQI